MVKYRNYILSNSHFISNKIKKIKRKFFCWSYNYDCFFYLKYYEIQIKLLNFINAIYLCLSLLLKNVDGKNLEIKNKNGKSIITSHFE